MIGVTLNGTQGPLHVLQGNCPRINQTACSSKPCLYNVKTDKTEHVDLADSQPAILKQLLRRWVELGDQYHPPLNPPLQPDEFCGAVAANHGFIGPWK